MTDTLGRRSQLLEGVAERRVAPSSAFELRSVPNGTGGSTLRFSGFASVTGLAYEMEDSLGFFTETVSVGAFRTTLARKPDVCLLLNHGGMTLARTKSGTLKLSEITDPTDSPVEGVRGLWAEATLDSSNPDVRSLRSAVERGDIDEMSFAFRVLRQDWNEDYDRRAIHEVDLDHGDVSFVNFGANEFTSGTVSMRQRPSRAGRPKITRTAAQSAVGTGRRGLLSPGARSRVDDEADLRARFEAIRHRPAAEPPRLHRQPPKRILRPNPHEKLAVHEAGHAVVARLLGMPVTSASIDLWANCGRVEIPGPELKASPMKELQVRLAGEEAEALAFGQRDEIGSRDDTARARTVAMGIGNAETLVRTTRAKVSDLLTRHWFAVLEVSLELREQWELSGADVERLCAGAPILRSL